MNILVTGANGFVGKNLCENLKIDKNINLMEFDIDTDQLLLSDYCKKADFVFHLAGVNRPQNEEDFMSGNFGFTSVLLETLKKSDNKCPILVTSSVQAELDNPYGKSKKAGEDLIFSYGNDNDIEVLVYRLPNLFGKWCRPNYNSVIATFCNNIANDFPITVNNRDIVLNLVYIDDLLDEFKQALIGKEHRDGDFCYVPIVYKESLGNIADTLYRFKESRLTLELPHVSNGFEKVLYSTYLSYLPVESFSYPVKMNCDNRGSFTELLKTSDRGQFSVNISNEGIEKGNHWHNTKNEKFIVVKGNAQINFRKIGEKQVYSYNVSGEKIEVVDIPVGYTHNIINTGKGELVTFMWANEKFDPNNPDTFFEPVENRG